MKAQTGSSSIDPPRFRRVPLIVGAILLLLVGIWGGLLRLGWPWPGMWGNAVVYHGPLMVSGFLGTLIAVERAVALGRRWAYFAPAASIAGSISLLAGVSPTIAACMITGASIVLVCVFIVITVRQPAIFTLTMGMGAVAWGVGNMLWAAGWVIPAVVPWWIGFLVLTIVGERLELSRFLPQSPRRQDSFTFVVGLYLLGLILGVQWPGLGWVVAGLGLIGLAGWLVVFDLARRTIRQTGLTRFVAVCLLSGYGWLVVAGLISVVRLAAIPTLHGHVVAWIHQAPLSGLTYDAMLHAVFLGFVFSMIFGHAAIIFPAVLNVRMNYQRRYYMHLILLQLSVALRIAADIADLSLLRRWAGLFNAIALLLFLLNTVTTVSLRRAEGGDSEPSVASPGSISLSVVNKSREGR